MNNKKLKVKKRYFAFFLLFIISLFYVVPTLAKYRSETEKLVVQLFTRYNVNYVTSGGTIINKDNFSSYLSINGLELPGLNDIDRKGYDLVGWYEDNNFSGNKVTKIPAGSYGDKTYYAAWTPARYTLSVSIINVDGSIDNKFPEGWDLVVGRDSYGNDNIFTLDENGEILIDKGETVSFRTSYSNDDSLVNLWNLGDDLIFSERYEDGSPYVYYDFVMPRRDIDAKYGVEEGYINLARSPIIFEENVNVGNRLQNGFWYHKSVSGMTALLYDEEKGYFYVWDNTEPFYVTTNNVETQNQLVLVNGLDVYFKDAKLVATDDYLSDVNNRKIAGIDVTDGYFGEKTIVSNFNNAGVDLSQYGNIVLKSDVHSKYTVNLYFEGDNNIVNSVFSDNVYIDSSYIFTVRMHSVDETAEVGIGSMFGNLAFYAYDIKINEVTKESDDFEYLFYSLLGSSVFSSSTISAPNKSILSAGSTSFASSNVDLLNTTASNYSLSGNTYLRVRNNVYLEYSNFSLSNTASAVIDGNLLRNYQHWSSTFSYASSGYLIVKGNRCDLSSSVVSNTKIICNAVTVGKSFSAKNTTIITNQIMNGPTKGWIVSNGEYISDDLGSTSSNPIDEKYPFNTFPQSSTGSATFTFGADNKIYLFGHYKTENGLYDVNVKATDEDNPIKKYLDVLLDENGDLKTINSDGKVVVVDDFGNESSVLAIDYDMLEQDIKNSTNVDKECILIGSSAYDTDLNYRNVVVDGSSIYAAGNISLRNDTVVNSGYIYSNGNFSSKRDLTINGGEIIANEIGNSYNLTTIVNDVTLSWSKTLLNAGKITANRIGPLSSCVANSSIVPKSSTNISSSVSITGNPEIIHDVYVNYAYNDELFSNSNDFNNVEFKGMLFGSMVLWYLDNEVEFSSPLVNSDGEQGAWNLNSLTGSTITKIDTYGMAKNIDDDVEEIFEKNYILLFAIKKAYEIQVLSGTDKFDSFFDENLEVLDINNVKVNTNVTLKLKDSSYIDKVVILYRDDSGIIHNVMPEYSSDSVKFLMPPANVEVYITDDMILNLSQSSYTITNSGFMTELEKTRDDSVFKYSGNIIIEQSELSKVTSSDLTSSTTSAKLTSNQISIDSDVNNLESGRTITLRKVLQKSSGLFSVGLALKDGAKVKLLIDGPIQLYRVEVLENSEIIFEGINGNTVDYVGFLGDGQGTYNNVSLGNYYGKTGNITLRNINIKAYSGRMLGRFCYGKTIGDAIITYENVAMTFSAWYSSSNLAVNVDKVIIKDNSTFNITNTSSWPSPLFSGVNNVEIKDSYISFLKNSTSSSSGGYPIFYGIKEEMLIDSSEIVSSIRLSTNTTIYKTTQSVGKIAPTVRLINNSKYTTEQRVRFEKIILEDNSELNVGEDKSGYLLCPNIEINDNAQINAGNVLVSGFYSSTSELTVLDDLLNRLKGNTNILDGTLYSGLVINGGVVNVSNFVGGDVNGKVIVNGGILNSKYIGNIGSLYGYTSPIPVNSTDTFVYSVSKIPSFGTKVIVNDGTVNVLESGYLGGMNMQVEVNGGLINLSDSAILGISEANKITLVNDYTSRGLTPSNFISVDVFGGEVVGSDGVVNIPYGKFSVSGNSTGINVKNIIGEKGSIHISNANNKYSNPYILDYGSTLHDMVGVTVSSAISAQSIIIDGGAVVYAKTVMANAIDSSDSGLLKVDSTEGNISYLYSDSYGSDGKGVSSVYVNNNALLNRQYSIFYTLNDTYQDSASNPNPLYYVSNVGLTLMDPVRYGYDFVGWYDTNGNKVTEISSSVTGDIYLGAKWESNKIQFRISVRAGDIGLSIEEFANQFDLTTGSFNSDGDMFTFNSLSSVGYNELIIGTGKIQLTDYSLNSYNVISIRVNNDVINPAQDEINVSSVVTKSMLDYYLESNEPIDILVTSISSKDVKTAETE